MDLFKAAFGRHSHFGSVTWSWQPAASAELAPGIRRVLSCSESLFVLLETRCSASLVCSDAVIVFSYQYILNSWESGGIKIHHSKRESDFNIILKNPVNYSLLTLKTFSANFKTCLSEG